MFKTDIAAVGTLLKPGSANAITTATIIMKTGLTDRQVRRAIEYLRRDTCIINNQDGKGYYIADNRAEAERYLRQEQARAKSIYRRLKGTRKYIKSIEGQAELDI